MGTLSQCSQREASLSYIEISVLFSNFPNFCMSQKAELPSLTGHRTKTRKRDEKQVNNPNGFRDSVIEGLVKAGLGGADITDPDIAVDLDAVFKFLDSAGNKFLKKSGLDGMLDQLFPTNKRTPENMKNVFITAEQPEIVTYLASLENAGAKKDIQRALRSSISDEERSAGAGGGRHDLDQSHDRSRVEQERGSSAGAGNETFEELHFSVLRIYKLDQKRDGALQQDSGILLRQSELPEAVQQDHPAVLQD